MTTRTVTIQIQVSPAISGGARIERCTTRRSSTWTARMEAARLELARVARSAYGNGGARVVVLVDDRDVWPRTFAVGEAL
jgi:hypothetical protein